MANQFGSTPQWALDNIRHPRVTPHTREAFLWILTNAATSGYSSVWGGSSYRPMGPGEYAVDHPSGTTFDIMVSPKVGASGDKTAGDWVAQQFILQHTSGGYQVGKIIWWGRQWTPSRGWYTYTPGGHRDHVHVRLTGTRGTAATSPQPTTQPSQTKTRLVVDGIMGANTIQALQRWSGATPDGIMGPKTIAAIQQTLNIRGASPQLVVDGVMGKNTIRGIQNYVGTSADGIMGPNTIRGIQKTLNDLGV